MKKIIILSIISCLSFCFDCTAQNMNDAKYEKMAMTELKKFPCYAFNSNNLNVKPSYGTEKIDRSKSLASMNSEQSGNIIASDHVALNNMTLAGYIQVALSASAGAPMRLTGRELSVAGKKYGKYCLYLDKFSYNVGIDEANIFIPKDYLYDSCEYNIILTHEKEHLKIYRQAISKYSMQLYTKLLNYLKNYRGALVFYDKNQAMAAVESLNKSLSMLVNDTNNALKSEAKYENWLFDDREYRLPSFKSRCSK